jgi:hypothetical protein
MVLMENLLPIVENQELRKNKREEFRSSHRLKSSNELFSCCRKTFRPTGVRAKNSMLHTYGAKRRRVLKGEKLAVRGQGISTALSTFVLKT